MQALLQGESTGNRFQKIFVIDMADLLSNALNTLKVSESAGVDACAVPNSKLVRAVLTCLKQKGYIASFQEKGKKIDVGLNGRINNCGAVRPRFFVKLAEWENYERVYLPSKDDGSLIVSTSQGVFTHDEAKKKRIGGTVLCFVY